MVQYDVYITLIFYRYIMKFVLFILILLVSCMVVGVLSLAIEDLIEI